MSSYYDQKPWLKTYPQWLPSKLTVPDHSILDAFLHAASAYPADPCIHYFDRTLNYKEIGTKWLRHWPPHWPGWVLAGATG